MKDAVSKPKRKTEANVKLNWNEDERSLVIEQLEGSNVITGAMGHALATAAVHQATMMMARRLNHVENIPQQDAAERALNKLAKTYSKQVDTLHRYRRSGKQVVRVERVNVESGGQAIVGDVSHGGRGQ